MSEVEDDEAENDNILSSAQHKSVENAYTGSPRRYEQFDSEPCSGGARVWYKTTDTTRSVCIKKFALPIGKFVKHYVNHHKTTLLTMMKAHMNFKALIPLLVNRSFVYE